MCLVTPRVTRIFLGSSEELAGDRRALGDFMNSVNNAYAPLGRRFLLVAWEHESIAIARQKEGKQAEYNELVRASDLCLFLFRTRCGEYTLQELEAALGERARTGSRPQVLVWVRKPVRGEVASPDLEALLSRLSSGELDLKYHLYGDLRAVEMDLLARLRAYGADLPMRRFGDFLYVADEPVIDLG